jgi:uncharacterized damage-inducible protein DinB
MNEPKTLTPRQKNFLQHLTTARDRLLEALDGLDEATLVNEPITGDWTAKDILGHVVSWNEEFRADIEVILEGRHPGYEHQISEDAEFGEWNQQQIARKRDWTWQRIRADFDRDYEEAAALIRRLRPEDFRQRGVTPWLVAATTRPATLAEEDTESVEKVVIYHWQHMNDHARALEKWRARREG